MVRGEVYGGAEISTLELAKSVCGRFNQIYIGSINTSLRSYLIDSGIELVIFPFSKYYQVRAFFKTLIQLRNFVKKNNIHIIHTQQRIFLPIIKLLNIKNAIHIYTARNVFFDNKYCFVKPDYTVAISKAVFKNLIEHHNFNPKRTFLINNGIKLRESPAPKDYYKGGRKLIVGFCGRFVLEKGVTYIIKAAALLKDLNIVFKIKGSGPELQNYIIEASKLNVTEQIVFENWDDNLYDFFKSIDVFVLPSIEAEGFGRVIIEAMMYGNIVIGTLIGGIPDIIQDSFNGYLVNPRSAKEIALKIIDIYQSGIPKDIINNGYQTISQFDILRVKEEYLKLYKAILNIE